VWRALAGTDDELRRTLRDTKSAEGTSPTLFDRSAPFQLRCAATTDVAHGNSGRVALGIGPRRDLGVDFALDPPVRRSSFYLDYAVEHVSTVEVRAPVGWKPGAAPEPVRVHAPCCGAYSRVVTATPTGFTVERTLTLPRLRIPASDAAAFRQILEQVAAGDEAMLSFESAP
jgi:hypothetical protein